MQSGDAGMDAWRIADVAIGAADRGGCPRNANLADVVKDDVPAREASRAVLK